MSAKKQSFVIYLLGSPGVGKYTIATEIARQANAVVVDNQLVNTPILTLLNWDGISQLPADVWDRIEPIREAVFSFMKDSAPRSINYVLTNALEDDGGESQEIFDRVKSIADCREAVFLPVHIKCDPEEQLKRVSTEQRKKRLKMSEPDQLVDYLATVVTLIPEDPNLFTLDVTELSPQEAAQRILKQVML